MVESSGSGPIVRETGIPGYYIIDSYEHQDSRGRFVKYFSQSALSRVSVSLDIRESYYSTSQRGVIRGLHFQVPPSEETKLVVCLSGEIYDVGVDLRTRSPEFGEWQSVKLTGCDAKAVVLAPGFAHGFASLADDSTVLYCTSSEYSPECDRGIRWDSVGVEWPVSAEDRVLSERDKELPGLMEFNSPF